MVRWERLLEVLVGPEAMGLSASTVSRLKQVWAQEYRAWCDERLLAITRTGGSMCGP